MQDHGEQVFAADGWTLYCEADRNGDGFDKLCWTAVSQDGDVEKIRHSPYEKMSLDAFRAHIALGFPSPQLGNWINKTIIAEAMEYAE